MRSIFLGVTSALLLATASGSDADAQAAKAGAATRVPATIAISDRLPAGSRFVVKRFPAFTRHDVILLASDASEEELGAAVRALLTVRQREGDIPAEKKTLRIRPTASTRPARPPFPWIARVLADVKRADQIKIQGVGAVRAVQIWLPGQNRPRPTPPKPRA